MYCNNCGKNNPEGSKFCQHCGIKLNGKQSTAEKTSYSGMSNRAGVELDSNTPPYPYVISTWKLVILSVSTFGLYHIYWFYKHWKSLKADRNLNVNPGARALFAIIMSYSMFREVRKAVRELDKSRGLEAGWLAIAFAILALSGRASGPYASYALISLLSFWPLIPVQNAINFYWERKYGNRLTKSYFGTSNVIWTVIGVIIFGILMYYGAYGSPSNQQ